MAFLRKAWSSAIGSLTDRALDGRFSSRVVQLELDVYRLYLLSTYYAAARSGASADDAARLSLEAAQGKPPAFRAQLGVVLKSLQPQVRGLLAATHTADYSGVGFRLDLGASTVPNAGQGVFVRGDCLPGAVVAFHPGVVYFPAYLREMPNYPHIAKDNSYLMSRYDNVVIDGQGWAPAIDASTDGPAVRDGFAVTGTKDTCFGLGHMVNHPPRGAQPNLQSIAFNIPAAGLEEHLYRYIPHRYHRVPPLTVNESGVVMHTLLLVASRHVADGEELFLNYRYNPAVAWPDWYTPVDMDADTRRWSNR